MSSLRAIWAKLGADRVPCLSAIREATAWYQQHLGSSSDSAAAKKRKAPHWKPDDQAAIRVVLLSDDAGNRRLAKEAGLEVYSVREYVAAMPDDKAVVLSDLVAQLGEIDANNLSGHEGAASKLQQVKTTYAPDYLPQSTLQAGLKAGTLHQGYFNLDPYNYREGSVKVHALAKPVLLVGAENTNRSVTGDLVVVEVLDESEWRAPADELLDEEGEFPVIRQVAEILSCTTGVPCAPGTVY